MAAKTLLKRNVDAKDEEKDEPEEDMTTPPKKANTNLNNRRKTPASPSMASPPPAKSAKAKKATKAKVELTHTKCRSYWLVRVTGSSEYGCMQFSYKTSSEEKAFAQAKKHCIKVCKDLGVEVPAVALK